MRFNLTLCIIGLLLTIPITALADVTVSVTPTTDTVLPGSVRSVYSNVQGSANVDVIWSSTAGALANFTGFTTWTAPAMPGTYTVTASSVDDGTKTASATFTVTTATVKTSNIPAQATIYKNQPLVIQSILWGSTNTSVAWTKSGGILTGTGREVVFSANAAGTYAVTATSQADKSKTATTTIVVTNNIWPGIATPNKTQPVDCTATGSGTTYEVTTEIEMDAVPWSTLSAGDTIRIHPGIYHRQLLISTSGSNSQPIRVCGVPDSNGNLPELNGANAKTKTGGLWGTGSGDLQIYAGIMIFNSGSNYFGGANYPKNIIIEGLKIAGYNQSNTFTDLSTGQVTSFNKAAAPIRIQRGGNITIRGNDLTDNGNGLFTMSNNSVESNTTRNLLVEGNYIHNNGVANDYLEHQSYLQAFGLVVQGNYYDLPRPGMPGGQLKTRSQQQFIRYNYMKPASRIFDLVENQDAPGMVFPWVGIQTAELVNTSPSDVVATYEAYQNRYVYGNIVENVGVRTSASIVHGSADNDQTYQSGGTLYVYHNTIVESFANGETSNYRTTLIDFGPYGTAIGPHTVFPTALLTNNAIYINSSTPPTGRLFFWNMRQPDRVILDKNWVSSNWGTGDTAGGDGTGIRNTSGDNAAAVWQSGQLTTQVYGSPNLVTGSTIPFDPSSFVPKSGSSLLTASAPLIGLASSLPPLMQYSPITYLMSRRYDALDIGAIAINRASPPTAPVGLK